jgi:hypothetical protein
MRRARRSAVSNRYLTQAATSVPAPVVVEVYAPQPRPQELAVLLAACSRAASPHDCITSDVKSTESPLGVAIVRRDGERARIELGLRRVVNAEWSTRDLVFQAGDDELERYRAIGFAIGTLVARQIDPPPPAPPETTTQPAAPVSRPQKPAPAPKRPPTEVPRRPARATWVDVAGNVGLGLIPGPPRVGGALRAASEIVPEGAFAVAETGYAERVGEPALRVRWLHVAAGVGHPLAPTLRSLGVEVRLMFALERMAFTAVDGARSGGAARWKPGLTGAIDAHWDVALPLSVIVSAATFIDPEHTVVRVGGVQVGETPALGLSGFIGLRLKLR